MLNSNHARLSDKGGDGDDERRSCAADLDQVLLYPTPEKIAAFLTKWGEPLRALLQDEKGNFAEYDDYDDEPEEEKVAA